MPALPVIAVFDVGKTNKKLLLFNEGYQVVHEQTARFAEIKDEHGFPCENLERLRAFVQDSLHMILRDRSFSIKAINVAAYGASFVYIDEQGEPLAPLYNYLKPFPESLQQQLYAKYGGAERFAVATASPLLGSLNSGLQLYRIKEEHPEVFQKVKYALHLPQYLSYLITSQAFSDLTSIGCHTALWDFEKVEYHKWVQEEGILPKLPAIHPTDKAVQTTIAGKACAAGIGIHDSSAALVPYHANFQEPFLLISTGTWCISLNPFNSTPLTAAELQNDCLCYLDYKGQPVKAARAFLGPQYEEGIKHICKHFGQRSDRYHNILFNVNILMQIQKKPIWAFEKVVAGAFFNQFENDMEAYYALMLHLVKQQYASAKLVMNKNVKRIFVDGGFSKNDVYMHLLASFFWDKEVYAASMSQGTALGAALAIHESWNQKNIPAHILDLKYYARTCELVI